MARYLQKPCPNHSPDEMTSCKLLQQSGGMYLLKCGACGFEFEHKAPTESHLGQFKYPHYCASTDQVFQNRSEEKSYAKKNGLEVV